MVDNPCFSTIFETDQGYTTKILSKECGSFIKDDELWRSKN